MAHEPESCIPLMNGRCECGGVLDTVPLPASRQDVPLESHMMGLGRRERREVTGAGERGCARLECLHIDRS